MEPSLNLRRITDALLHRWKLIAVLVFIIPIVTIVLSRVYRPAYEANARLLIQQNQSPFLRDLSVDLEVQNRFPVVRNLLQSRTVVEAILRDLGEVDETSSPGYVDSRVDGFQNAMEITDLGGGVFNIVVRGRTPEQALSRVQALMHSLVDEMLRPQRESLNASVSFLQDQLTRMSGELADAEQRIREFKEEHAEELPQVFEGNLNRYLATLSDLQQAQADQAVAQRQLSLSEEELAAYAADPLLGELESDLVQAQHRRDDLLHTYTEDHPDVIRAERRVQALQDELEQRRRNPPQTSLDDLERQAQARVEVSPGQAPRVVASDLVTGELLTRRSVMGDVESLRYRIARLEAQRDELRETIRSYAGNEQELNDLMRDVDAKGTLYNDLLGRLQEARLTRELTLNSEASRVWTIEEPTLPPEDNRIGMKVAGIQGIILGLVLGAALVVGLEVFDRTVRLPSEAETLTGIPTVAVLPKLFDRVG